MKKIDTVIFDWAGTTVDYGCFAPVEAFRLAFDSFGIKADIRLIRKSMGIAKYEHVKKIFEDTEISEQWKSVYGKAYIENDILNVYKKSEEVMFGILADYSEPKPFVCDAVKKLRKMGIKIGSTTGYTSKMMDIVLEKAKRSGYCPDFLSTPDSVNLKGRPYPFMIFDNMINLNSVSVSSVIKVGDTVADIEEGRNAGVVTVGVVEGSSLSGMSESEFEKLSEREKESEFLRVSEIYKNCGADYVIKNMNELVGLITEEGVSL